MKITDNSYRKQKDNMNREPVIQFTNFSFQYDSQKRPTLHDINLTIHQGEKILIIGPSGSGKSTLGNCLNGLIPFAYKGKIGGSVNIYGHDLTKMNIYKCSQYVGTVLQDADSQFVGLSVGEDIAFELENDNMHQKEMHEKVKAVAGIVDLQQFLQRSPFELSGGQKQRACLAGAMVADAPILLFDEPLANLDPATGKSAIELIDEIAEKQNKTVIIIEHRLEDVLHRHIDRILLINHGTIIADMTPSQLLCSDLLEENGIREPLYIAAMRYANVDLNQVQNVDDDTKYDLVNQKEKVNTWYKANYRMVEPSNKPVILQVKDLSFSYDGITPILDHIDLTIHSGEMMAIVGKNGAGKSTLSKCIVGFEKMDEGTIVYNGQTINDWTIKERAQAIGYVLQNPNQMICKSMIFDEVALGLVQRGLDKATIESKVYETLKICGLYEYRNWPISALSYGQKKRVTIASILVLEPSILILDEPTAGQDYRHYSEIMEFLSELNSRGITIVLITHDMHLMLEYTHRCVVITDGQIIADTTGSSVLSNEELVNHAALKKTSLYDLARKCDIDDPVAFIDTFIAHEHHKEAV